MKTEDLYTIIKVLENKNIALIGHMGSGKSIIGKLLSAQFNIKHLDSDKEIEKLSGQKINDIFRLKGEEYFRSLEEKILLKILRNNNTIISLGGGSIINQKIRNLLKTRSITIFLDVKLEDLEKRLEKTQHRPLLKNQNIKKKIKELDSLRRKYYSDADIIIKNNQSINNTIKTLKNKLFSYHER